MIDLSRALWRKSSRSNAGGDCVEVATTERAVGMRDSKNTHGPVLVFTPDQWRAFVEAVKDGEFDG
jgi:hypothetical protein